MKIGTRIDWLSFSKPNAIEEPVFMSEMSNVWKLTNANQGYDYAIKYQDGRIVMNGQRNGTFIQYSGSVLNEMISLGINPLSIIEHHLIYGYRLARIDIAVDVWDSGLNINSLKTAFENKEVSTKAKSCYEIKNVNGGHTLYIGSRTSEKFLRVYDKGKELGDNTNWKRIELEMKGAVAQQIGSQVLLAKSLDDFIIGNIRSFIDFTQNKVWNNIMVAEKINSKVIKQKESDTRKWLLDVCALSLVKEYIDGDDQIIYDFMEVVSSLIKGKKLDTMKSTYNTNKDK